MQASWSLDADADSTEDTTTVSRTGDTSSSAIPPVTRESSSHAGLRRLRWRDPASNRGHHDFQFVCFANPPTSVLVIRFCHEEP